jgi:hypothetical protein
LLGGILFHLQIIKTEGKDNRKNRLKTWESIIDCTLYDDSLIKNLLYYEDSSEKLNLLKHYDRIKTFFAEIDFKAGIICINEIEQKLDKKK